MVSVSGDRQPGDKPTVEITADGDATRTIISTTSSTRWRMLSADPESIGLAVLQAMEEARFPAVVITTDELRR